MIDVPGAGDRLAAHDADRVVELIAAERNAQLRHCANRNRGAALEKTAAAAAVEDADAHFARQRCQFLVSGVLEPVNHRILSEPASLAASEPVLCLWVSIAPGGASNR